MKCVSVVLVGIGGYGNTYVEEILKTFDTSIKLVGVVDPYPERCVYLEKLKQRDIPIYSDMEAFYADYSADLAVISTPIFLHTQHILTALSHGSHALCEKPLCGDEEDIPLLEEAQMRSGKRIFVGYQWAFSDSITGLKQDIISGKFGRVIEMKTLVLRPRNRAYFERGVGWAGKIKTSDGMLVYDSVANNSAAHFLFNMLYVIGEYGKAAAPVGVTAELMRANKIENFDSCKIDLSFEGGGKASFIAVHPVNKGIEPVFEYEFEAGKIYYACECTEETKPLMPAEYTEYGNVVAIMNDGEKIVYGNPMDDECKKLYVAVQTILDEKAEVVSCGLEAAAVHTRLVNMVQKQTQIKNFEPMSLREENGYTFVEGLFEKALSCYLDTSNSLK